MFYQDSRLVLVKYICKQPKRVVQYIKGTITYGVKFQKSKPVKLCGYPDSDWGSSEDDAKSTSRYCFSLGSGIFSWSCKKQDIVAQSTAEAEFVKATTTVNQALWLKKILVDLLMEPTGSIKVFVDNEATKAISHNLAFHGRTKHFKVKFFFWREVQKDGDITLVYCKTEEQLLIYSLSFTSHQVSASQIENWSL